MAGEFSMVKSGKQSEFEWSIKYFKFSSYTGPVFKFEGESWFLSLYHDSIDGYMCLYLKRISPGPPIAVEFSVALETKEKRKIFERHERKCFEGGKKYDIEWISSSEFNNRYREFLLDREKYPFGWLTILFTMKKADSGETESASAAAAAFCSTDSLRVDKISLDRKFLDKLVKCAQCNEVLSLKNWFGHECQTLNAKGESGALYPSVSEPKVKTVQDLKNLFFNQENCDVVLRVQGQEFAAHQAILTARSPVFASTFRSNMKEKETGTVDIEDIDPSSFPEFLCFLYCGEIDKLSAQNVYSLFIAADKYEIPDLRAICIQFMKENFTVDAFCETLLLALLHTETELFDSCTAYFIQNAEEIIKSVQWQNFVAENPSQGNELFLKYVQSPKK